MLNGLRNHFVDERWDIICFFQSQDSVFKMFNFIFDTPCIYTHNPDCIQKYTYNYAFPDKRELNLLITANQRRRYILIFDACNSILFIRMVIITASIVCLKVEISRNRKRERENNIQYESLFNVHYSIENSNIKRKPWVTIVSH